VIRLGALGDVVRTLPAASALRAAYPGAELVWLVERKAMGAVLSQPWVDEVVVFPREELAARWSERKPLALLREAAGVVNRLRRRRFDLVIDFHAILKSGLLAWLAGAPLRASYARPHAREISWLFANRRAVLGAPPISRFERNLALVRFLGVETPPVERSLRLDPAAVARIEARLEGLERGEGLVALHPGTSESTPYKRYTVSGYAKVARDLAEQQEVLSLVTWGPARGERRFAEAIVREAGTAARLAPETASLDDLAALFSRCRLFLGSDSGPLHVASLVGTPVVQILGPTHPVENQPYPGTPSRSVRVPVACSPCRRGCAAPSCMAVVPPGLIADAARELLAEAPLGSSGGSRRLALTG
jgi:ADP-heptose:LPS heptosyltransferase